MANEYVDPHPYYWAQASQLPTTIHGWGAGTELPAGLTGKSFAEVVHPFYREFPDIDADVSGGASITDLMTGAAGAGTYSFPEGAEGYFNPNMSGFAPGTNIADYPQAQFPDEMLQTMIDIGIIDAQGNFLDTIYTGGLASGMTQDEFYNLSPEERYAVAEQFNWADPGTYQEGGADPELLALYQSDPAAFMEEYVTSENKSIKDAMVWGGIIPTDFASMPVGNLPEGVGNFKQTFEGQTPGIPSFTQGWYEPAYMANVELPSAETIGSPYSVGNIRTRPDYRQYETLAEAGISPGTSIYDKFLAPLSSQFADLPTTGTLPWHTGSAAEGILPKGAEFDTDLTDIERQLDDIVVGYEQGLGDIATFEARDLGKLDERIENIGKMEDEAKLTKAEKLLGAKIDRTKAVRGRDQEYEAARVPQARFGGAYSGPAAQVQEDVATENIKELGDIKRQELGAIKDYDLSMEEYAGQREDIEGPGGEREETIWDYEYGPQGRQQLLTSSEGLYNTGLTNLGTLISSKILPDITGIANRPSTYAQDWGAFGDQFVVNSPGFNTGIVGRSPSYGAGYGGSPFFSETWSPQMQLAGDIGAEAEAWNRQLASLLPSLMGEINPFGEVTGG